MPGRREFFGRIVAGVGGAYILSRGLGIVPAAQGQSARREVRLNGRRVRVIDAHAHCVIPVQEIVAGTALAGMGGGGGNNILGPQRLEVMDQQGVDIQALSINGYWWYAADEDLARWTRRSSATRTRKRFSAGT